MSRARPPAGDHRTLGQTLELWLPCPDAFGTPILLRRGVILRRIIEDALRARVTGAGFQEVSSPMLWREEGVFLESGHLDRFRDKILTTSSSRTPILLKPATCPPHIWLYQAMRRNHAELPLRYFDLSGVFRNEASGTLRGLTTSRFFHQDDAHVFGLRHDIERELERIVALAVDVHRSVGLEVRVEVVARHEDSPVPEEAWRRGQEIIGNVLGRANIPFTTARRGTAFGGPQIFWHVRLPEGEERPITCIQVDEVLPQKFGLTCTGPGGTEETPVMLHVALLGSIERYLATILEHHRGVLPFSLCPDQVGLASVRDAAPETLATLERRLAAVPLRVLTDPSADHPSRKFERFQKLGVPVVVFVGKREIEQGTVSLRNTTDPDRLQEMPVGEVVAYLAGRVEAPF